MVYFFFPSPYNAVYFVKPWFYWELLVAWRAFWVLSSASVPQESCDVWVVFDWEGTGGVLTAVQRYHCLAAGKGQKERRVPA